MATNATTTTTTLHLLLLLLLLAGATTPTTAINITRLLSDYPNFQAFSNLLNQTGLVPEINRRRTITILAVDNSGIGDLSGRPLDAAKRILSVHVILDYYDRSKFRNFKRRSRVLTTLFQTTGTAGDHAGFLNMTRMPDGSIMFGSHEAGAGLVSKLIEPVVARPYNISILHVSNVIIPPGIDDMKPVTFFGATPPPAKDVEKPADAPASEEEESPAPEAAEAPAEVEEAEADSPAEGPEAEGPVADVPEANGPKKKMDADDDDDTEAPTKDSSGGGGVRMVGAGVAATVVAAVVLLGGY